MTVYKTADYNSCTRFANLFNHRMTNNLNLCIN